MLAPAYAHSGPCSRPETLSTFGVAAGLAVVLVRPWGKTMTTLATKLRRSALPLVLATVLTVSGCGGRSSTSTTARPTTDARLQILEPAPNQVTGPDVVLRLQLIGARVVAPSQGKLRPDEGHIHVSLDNRLVSMTYGTTQDLHALGPGPHALQAEFVAVDHAPFRNRVVAAVLFRVGP
jgi:hypothetical protein